jgi:hypothetical protein
MNENSALCQYQPKVKVLLEMSCLKLLIILGILANVNCGGSSKCGTITVDFVGLIEAFEFVLDELVVFIIGKTTNT